MTDPTTSRMMREFASRRRRVEHVCAVCGEKFSGYVNARTCSNKCRQALKRQRGKEKQQ